MTRPPQMRAPTLILEILPAVTRTRARHRPAAVRPRTVHGPLLTQRRREMDSNYWFRHGETPFGRARWAPRTAPPARRGTDPERDEKFESRLLQRRVSSAKTRRTRRFRHSAAELGYQVTVVRDATAAHM